MLAYWFRVIDGEAGKPNGFVGMAVAADMTSMYWEIDQYCNPYSVEVKSIRNGSFCSLEGLDWSEEGFELDIVEGKRGEFETSESMPFSWDDGWRAPAWGSGYVVREKT